MCYKLLETVCSHAQVVDPPAHVWKWQAAVLSLNLCFVVCVCVCVCLSGTGREQPSSLLCRKWSRSWPGRFWFCSWRSTKSRNLSHVVSSGDDKGARDAQTLTWSASMSAGLELFQFGGQRRSRSEPTEQHLSWQRLPADIQWRWGNRARGHQRWLILYRLDLCWIMTSILYILLMASQTTIPEQYHWMQPCLFVSLQLPRDAAPPVRTA